MKEKHIGGNESKGIFYGELEAFAREKIHDHLQDLLEQEVTEWLEREKSERKIPLEQSSESRFETDYCPILDNFKRMAVGRAFALSLRLK